MRYLTRVADQLVSLISVEHGEKLVWRDVASNESEDSNFEDSLFDDLDGGAMDSDRFFDFEVVVKKDQEEGVSISPGFCVSDFKSIFFFCDVS